MSEMAIVEEIGRRCSAVDRMVVELEMDLRAVFRGEDAPADMLARMQAIFRERMPAMQKTVGRARAIFLVHRERFAPVMRQAVGMRVHAVQLVFAGRVVAEETASFLGKQWSEGKATEAEVRNAVGRLLGVAPFMAEIEGMDDVLVPATTAAADA